MQCDWKQLRAAAVFASLAVLVMLAQVSELVSVAAASGNGGTTLTQEVGNNPPTASTLVVVGAVTETSARVLFDVINIPTDTDNDGGDTSSLAVTYQLSAKAAGDGTDAEVDDFGDSVLDVLSTAEFEADLTKPTVVTLDGLAACSDYVVTFLFRDRIVDKANINTKCPGIFQSLALSCDRYLDDKDNDFVKILHANVTGRESIFHLGDQLYLDDAYDYYKALPAAEVYPLLRALYHTMWNREYMRDIMRTASHYMIPDDHDMFNAIVPDVLNKFSESRGFIEAAHLCVMFYQVQLTRDVDDEAVRSLRDIQVYNHHVEAGVGVFMLDVRYTRALSPFSGNRSGLVGEKQLEEFEKIMAEWESSSTVSSVMIYANMPLLYPSPWWSGFVEVVEGDLYPSHEKNFAGIDALVSVMHRVNKKKDVSLVIGDLHMVSWGRVCQQVDGTTQETTGEGEKNCFKRFVTSGITRGSAAGLDPKLALFNSATLWTGDFTTPSFSTSSEASDKRWVLVLDYVKLTNNFFRSSAGSRVDNNDNANANGDGASQLVHNFVVRDPFPYEDMTQFFMFKYGFPMTIGFVISVIYQCVNICAWCRRSPQASPRQSDENKEEEEEGAKSNDEKKDK